VADEIKNEELDENVTDGLEPEGEPEEPEVTAGSESGVLEVDLYEQEKQRAEEYYASLQRLKAEFDNFRKRTQKEKEDLAKYGAERLLVRLLPVLDNLERALNTAAQVPENSLQTGVEMIYRLLQKVLEEEGLEPIPAVGCAFDPNLHEALLSEASEAEENSILAELEKGYYLKGRVIRPSRVKVSI
jgi:molecular chaperone GrpE